MKIESVSRNFKFKDRELEDPNPKMTVQQVKDFYSNEYPELTNAVWKENQNGTSLKVEFETAVGKKG